MLRSLQCRKARYFMKSVAPGAVPVDEPCVNSGRMSERVISLRIGDIDRLPRWQYEDYVVELICAEHGIELFAGQVRRLVDHGDGLDRAAIEEDPLAASLLLHVFPDVATQNLSSKGEWVRPGRFATRARLHDDAF